MKKIIPILFLMFSSQCFANNQSASQENITDSLYSSALTAKVRTALIADSEVKSLPITVISYQSTVQLCGFVDSKDQAARAVELTKGVNGVQGVINNLVLH